MVLGGVTWLRGTPRRTDHGRQPESTTARIQKPSIQQHSRAEVSLIRSGDAPTLINAQEKGGVFYIVGRKQLLETGVLGASRSYERRNRHNVIRPPVGI